MDDGYTSYRYDISDSDRIRHRNWGWHSWRMRFALPPWRWSHRMPLGGWMRDGWIQKVGENTCKRMDMAISPAHIWTNSIQVLECLEVKLDTNAANAYTDAFFDWFESGNVFGPACHPYAPRMNNSMDGSEWPGPLQEPSFQLKTRTSFCTRKLPRGSIKTEVYSHI